MELVTACQNCFHISSHRMTKYRLVRRKIQQVDKQMTITQLVAKQLLEGPNEGVLPIGKMSADILPKISVTSLSTKLKPSGMI